MKKLLLFSLILILIFVNTGCNNFSLVTICLECEGYVPSFMNFCPNCGAHIDTNITNSDTITNSNTNNTNNNVSSALDFLNSIASNTTITLSADISFLTSYTLSNPSVTKTATGYIIKDINNLVIDGNHTIQAVGEKFAFLRFENCSNIEFRGITFNLKTFELSGEPVSYLSFSKCNNISIENCTFKNGSSAIILNDCSAIKVSRSTFDNMSNTYDSTLEVIRSTSSTAEINSCSFLKCQRIFSSNTSNLVITNSSISGIDESILIVDKTNTNSTQTNISYSNILFENCTLKDNKLLAFFAHQPSSYSKYTYEHPQIKFQNCKITNNIYCNGIVGESNFINCSTTDTNEGVIVPNYIYDNADITQESIANTNCTIVYSYEDISAQCNEDIPYTIVKQSHSGIVSKKTIVRLTASKPSVLISQVNFDINSADGVEPNITFTNTTDKQIAYIYFTLKFYDRMGSPAICSIQKKSVATIKVTGPIEAGRTYTRYWDPVIYHGATAAIKPTSIEVHFTDGTKQTITCINDIYWYTNSYYGGNLKD